MYVSSFVGCSAEYGAFYDTYAVHIYVRVCSSVVRLLYFYFTFTAIKTETDILVRNACFVCVLSTSVRSRSSFRFDQQVVEVLTGTTNTNADPINE